MSHLIWVKSSWIKSISHHFEPSIGHLWNIIYLSRKSTSSMMVWPLRDDLFDSSQIKSILQHFQPSLVASCRILFKCLANQLRVRQVAILKQVVWFKLNWGNLTIFSNEPLATCKIFCKCLKIDLQHGRSISHQGSMLLC